jgi:predicted transcriptional regulator YdeE
MEHTVKKLIDLKSGLELMDHTNEVVHRTSFQHAGFHDVDMRDTDLKHINFVRSKWEHIYFSDVHVQSIQLGGTVFENIIRPQATSSQLTEEHGTDGWVNVEPVQFRNSDLSKAIFDNCLLRDVELRDCDIEGLTINGVNILELLIAYRAGRVGSQQGTVKQGIISVELIDKPSFQAVGLTARFIPGKEKPSESTAARLWESFNNRSRQLPHQAVQGRYGISFFDPDHTFGKEIGYLAGVHITEPIVPEDLPDDMVVKQIPASTYAVVSYKGTIDGISSIYDHYWREWLPSSSYEPAYGNEFEYYDHRYLGNHNPDSVMQVYFPVRKKEMSSNA